MAKICEHCKQPYPDDLDHCPHCAPAVELVDENEAETFLLQDEPHGQEGHGTAHAEEPVGDEAQIDFAGLEEAGPPSGSSGVVLGLEPEDLAPAAPADQSGHDSAVDLAHPAEDLDTGAHAAAAGPPGGTPHDAAAPHAETPPRDAPVSDVYLAEEVPSAVEAEQAGPLSDVFPAEAAARTGPLSDVLPAEDSGKAGPVSDVFPAEEVEMAEPVSDVYPAEEGHAAPPPEGHAEPAEEVTAEAWVLDEGDTSAVDLGASAAPAASGSSVLDLHPAEEAGKEPSAIDLGALDAAGSSSSAINLSEAEPSSSAIDLSGLEGHGAAHGAGDSAVHLESAEEPAAPAGDLDFAPEALEPGASEVYMHPSQPEVVPPAGAPGDSGVNLFADEPEEAAVADGEATTAEEVRLGEEGPTSARDIVEEVESGVDLGHEREAAAVGAGGEHDSAVDLGGDYGEALGEGSAVGAGSAPGGPGEEHLDELGAAAVLDQEQEHAAAEPETLAAEAPEDEMAPVAAGEGAEEDRGRRWESALAGRAGLVPWVGGGLIGAAATAVLVAVLWFLNVLPSRQPARPPANAVANARTGGPQQPAAAPPSLDLGQTQLHGGDYTKALDTFGQMEQGNAENPAFLAARGQALWLKTLQQLHQEGKPVTRDELAKNPDVAKAKDDLQKAGTADALFWLGMIQDQTDGPDAARKTFEQAMAKFPDQKRRFQAAIDRLDLSGPDKEAGARLSPEPGSPAELYWMSAALVALQAQPPGGESSAPAAGAPAPGQPAPAGAAPAADEEAGYDFWDAVKLARENKYPQAIAEIDKARSLHDRLRYSRLGKAQNPNSDPYEEIFLRACDELRVYWQVREKLAEAGYLNADRRASPREILAAVDRATKGEADVKAARKQVEQVVAALKEAGVKTDDPVKGVADLQEACKKAEKQVEQVAAALKDAGVKTDDPVKGVADLEETRKKAEKKIDDVTAALKTAGVKADDPVKGVADLEESRKAVQKELDGVTAALKTGGVKTDDPVKGAEEIVASLGRSNDELDALRKKLVDRQYLPGTATRADVPRGVDKALEDAEHPLITAVAQLVDDVSGAGGRLANRMIGTVNLEGELASCRLNAVRLEAQLANRRTPEQMMDIWLTTLQDHPSPALADEALQDAQRVLSGKPMPAAVCVRGLAERSKGDFARARADLQTVVKTPVPESRWFRVAQANLRQLSDPSAWYLPKVRELRAEKKYPEALATVDQALQVFSEDAFPADHASLLALRSEVRLDQVRSAGAGEKSPPALQASDEDAAAAVAGGDKVEGNYALGRVAEMRGELPKAEAFYRQSLEAYDAAAKDPAALAKAHPVSDPLGNRYREALSRVLLEEVRQAKAAPPKETAPPEGARTTRLDADSVLAVVRPAYWGSCVQLTAACLALAQPGGGAVAPVEAPDERLQEVLRLADQMIAAGDYRGYLLRGEVLGRMHRWYDALLVMREGIRKALPAQEAAPLEYVLENHPCFQRREGIRPPDPVVAEEHFETGVRQYFDGRYAEAERSFADAVYYNDQDARYLYYLGLARLAQPGKRDTALEDFRQAARLEARDRPSSAAVSTALERVQGPARRILNHIRVQTIEEATAAPR